MSKVFPHDPPTSWLQLLPSFAILFLGVVRPLRYLLLLNSFISDLPIFSGSERAFYGHYMTKLSTRRRKVKKSHPSRQQKYSDGWQLKVFSPARQPVNTIKISSRSRQLLS